jgi:hypothetical protein
MSIIDSTIPLDIARDNIAKPAKKVVKTKKIINVVAEPMEISIPEERPENAIVQIVPKQKVRKSKTTAIEPSQESTGMDGCVGPSAKDATEPPSGEVTNDVTTDATPETPETPAPSNAVTESSVPLTKSQKPKTTKKSVVKNTNVECAIPVVCPHCGLSGVVNNM